MSQIPSLLGVLLAAIVVIVVGLLLIHRKRKSASLAGWTERQFIVSPDNRLPPEIEQELREWLNNNPTPVYPDPMLPPWQVMPDVPLVSIGWRMGSGEDYMIAFRKWFRELSAEERTTYIAGNSEPDGWGNFYAILERDLD